MYQSKKKSGTSNEWPDSMTVKMSGKFDETKEVVMEKYVREKMMDMSGQMPYDLMNKGQLIGGPNVGYAEKGMAVPRMQDFHEDYKSMLGQEFMESIRANPYESTNTKSDSSGTASPAFKKRKGMAQHQNEMQRERSHRTLQYHLRNDNDFI